ncbi:MAG: hypothetical protein H6728_11300 [Myxococcales bacterium]|nr:hypothetical protein [Myxococcales bacterium]MCB9643648.1 hypothetical protein [Myxococcales bacterium]
MISTPFTTDPQNKRLRSIESFEPFPHQDAHDTMSFGGPPKTRSLRLLFWMILGSFGYMGFSSVAHASSMTFGEVRCWPIKKQKKHGRLSVTWASHCGGGRSCSRTIHVEYQQHGKWRAVDFGYATYPHRDGGIKTKVLGCWKNKKRYFSFQLKQWKKQLFHIEIMPTQQGHKLRLYAARKHPLQTQGWLKGLRCKILYRATTYRRCPKKLP